MVNPSRGSQPQQADGEGGPFSSPLMHPYDAIAEQYDAAYSGPRERAENVALARFLGERGMFREASPWRPLMDLGCGTGLALELAQLSGRSLEERAYVGVDPSAGMLAVARRRWPGYEFLKESVGDWYGHGNRQWIDGSVVQLQASAVISLFGSASYMQPWALATTVQQLLVLGGQFAIMGYQRRFVDGPDYAKLRPPGQPRIWLYDAALWRMLYGWAVGLEVRGFSLWTYRWPAWARERGERWLERALRLELAGPSAWWPERGDFWLVTGRVP